MRSMTNKDTLIALVERVEGASAEEMAVSMREHPSVHADILRFAIGLARDRGGQTIPVSDYDIVRAKDAIRGEASENARLRSELRKAKAEIVALRARAAITPDHPLNSMDKE